MFGVIVCPHCTLVQGADLNMARITCPRCGGKIELRRAKVYFSTDSPKDLAAAVRQVGERLIYDIEMPSGPRPEVPVRKQDAKKTAADEQSLRSAVIKLASGKEDFGREEIREALEIEEEGDLDQTVARLLNSGIIYEVAPGRYRPA